ncbi:MAG: hypothetical protein CMM50_06230 [Rhodospirillaceae bacterium]|nr:hypothetical protein [Rhodospirillaceae bacterium]
MSRLVSAVAMLAGVLVLAAGAIRAQEQARDAAGSAVLFGGDANYPPFEWLDGGNARGFLIALEDAVAATGGAEATHRLGDWPDIIAALEAGEVDVVPMFVSPEREEIFGFTRPFYYLSHSIYGGEGAANVHDIRQLAGHRVVVENRSYAQNELMRLDIGATLVLAPNTLAALRTIAAGDAEYGVLAAPPSDWLINLHDLPVEAVGPPFWPRPYAFAVRKDREALLAWLDEALEITFASGRYEEVSKAYAAELAPRPGGIAFSEALRQTAAIVGGLALIALVAGGWSWLLRRRVRERTQELADELARREQAEARLRHLANHDAETGLPTLSHFLELADDTLKAATETPGAEKEVVALRLADLESIVMNFGYDVAQGVVRAFGRRLQGLGLDTQAHAGRGAFVVLADRGAVRSRISQMTARLDTDRLTLFPQVVAGAAAWPQYGENTRDLVRRAETALATSLERHQAWADFEPSFEPEKSDLQLVGDFRQSGSKGLHAVFQPQVDLDSGRIVAAEILVRWNHPRLGPVSPARFIPLLEDVGLIMEVTAFMIDEAARVASGLRRAGTPCTLSVNVAAYDLTDTDLPRIVETALKRHDTAVSDLQLELTETSVAEDPSKVREALGVLRTAGVQAAIDDFGTGYSSLAYLSQFPVGELKIDQMFVKDLLANERHHLIVRSTISMAHALGLLVVAEGVEDIDTITALREDSCDRVQGYAITKPLPETDFREFLKQGGLPH